MSQAFKRIYIDIPPEVHTALKVKAAEQGMSQRALVARIIQDHCQKPEPKTKRAKKKRTSRSKK